MRPSAEPSEQTRGPQPDRRRRASSAHGFSVITLLIYIVIAGAIYAGVVALPAFRDYYDMNEKFRASVNSMRPDMYLADLRHDLYRTLKDKGFKITQDQLTVRKEQKPEKGIFVEITYDYELNLFVSKRVIPVTQNYFVHEDRLDGSFERSVGGGK